MNPRFPRRRMVALGAAGLAVAFALPVIVSSVAGAGPSKAQHDAVQPAAPSAASAQPARSVVYGTATETTVTVYRQALPQGTPEVLFSYENHVKHNDPDEGVEAPELALSPDGRSVAYFARSGLRLHHLDSGADEVVIGRSDPGPGVYDAPTWTIDELNAPVDEDSDDPYRRGMFSVEDIAFSPDGRFLSFGGDWYGYKDHRVIELATRRHWKDDGSLDLAWSPSSDRVAVAGAWYTEPGRLAVSARGDFGSYTAIRPVPDPKPDLSYGDVEIAGDGNRIAFTFSDQFPDRAGIHLATSTLDGTGYAQIETGGLTEAIAFNDDTLYSVERRMGQRRIVAHDPASGESRDVASVPQVFTRTRDFWVTASGELAVVAATTDEGLGFFLQRLLVFTPDGRLLGQSPVFDTATRFIGAG